MITFSKRAKKHLLCAVSMKAVALFMCLTLAFLVCSLAVVDSGASEVFLSKKRKLPIYSVQTDQKLVALTFDAAYGADKTEQIIQILKDHGATATFFLVGFWVDKYPNETKMIADNGFEIGTHSNEHAHMSKMTEESITRDLTTSIEKIESITGVKPTLFRAPYGEYDNKVVSSAENLGLYTIQWDVDSIDWKGISGDKMTARVVSKVKPGSIALFHNNSDHILDALPRILELLTARGYKFCKVSDLIYKSNYYIDNNGMQIPIVEDKK